ncbi:MAG: hypothetical protein ACRCVT_01650 [Leadbetterella sp.]
MILYFVMLILCGLSSYFWGWWTSVPILFLLSAWKLKTPTQGAKLGGATLVSLWVIVTSVLLFTSEGNFMAKIGSILTSSIPFLENVNKTGIVFKVLIIISGLVGSLSGLSGVLFRLYFKKKV